MNEIEFVPLNDISEAQILNLMNNEAVGRQLPTLGDGFSADDCRAFLAEKQRLWDEYGFGPWAFVIEGHFAGWGGLQPEQGEADFALVLHPDFWGWGRKIFTRVKQQAFGPMGLDRITILLPPGRTNSKAVHRLGFVEEDAMSVNGKVFRRFRLSKA